jgi:glutathione reductase (NADPH)
MAATGGMPLTPISSLEGKLVAANLLNGKHTTADYTGIQLLGMPASGLLPVPLRDRANNMDCYSERKEAVKLPEKL